MTAISEGPARPIFEALQQHIADSTDGDLLLGYVIIAAVHDQAAGHRTSMLVTSGAARYEIKGLLADGLDMVRDADRNGPPARDI